MWQLRFACRDCVAVIRGWKSTKGVRTFDAASFLRRKGADSVRVRKMFKNDMGDYKAKAEVVRSAEIIGESIAVAASALAL